MFWWTMRQRTVLRPGRWVSVYVGIGRGMIRTGTRTELVGLAETRLVREMIVAGGVA